MKTWVKIAIGVVSVSAIGGILYVKYKKKQSEKIDSDIPDVIDTPAPTTTTGSKPATKSPAKTTTPAKSPVVTAPAKEVVLPTGGFNLNDKVYAKVDTIGYYGSLKKTFKKGTYIGKFVKISDYTVQNNLANVVGLDGKALTVAVKDLVKK